MSERREISYDRNFNMRMIKAVYLILSTFICACVPFLFWFNGNRVWLRVSILVIPLLILSLYSTLKVIRLLTREEKSSILLISPIFAIILFGLGCVILNLDTLKGHQRTAIILNYIEENYYRDPFSDVTILAEQTDGNKHFIILQFKDRTSFPFKIEYDNGKIIDYYNEAQLVNSGHF
jgi:hypothetical protein